MGFFKSTHQLYKQAKEIDKDFHPGQMAQDAQQRMAATTQWMAQQTQAANMAASGADVQVTITEMRQEGMMNFEPMMAFELTVMPEGLPPYPATVRQTVPMGQLSLIRRGATLHAKVDPNDPASIWLDLTSAA